MSTRRGFLTQAGLFSAGLLVAPKLLSARGDTKIGLQLYSLREQLPKDVKGVIAKVAEAGYQQVETFGYSKDHGFWGLSASEFSKVLKANHLVTPSGHYGADALFANGTFGEIDEAAEAALATGQQYVTIPYINEKYRKTPADLKEIARKLNLAGERLKKVGLKLGYHNHNIEFLDVEGQLLYDVMLSETNPELVHFEMDIYWVVRAGQDPLHWIDKYPGRFTMVHMKDMDKNQPELNTEIGNGSIDFKPIIAKAKKAGIKYYIMEQENYKIDPYVSIAESARYMKSILP